MSYQIVKDSERFFRRIDSYLNQEDRARVRAAFAFARREHGTQRRKTGELFFIHPLAVAHYLAEYDLDAPALMAALMHDVAEDTPISIEGIEAEFGAEVALLVNGVTKLKELTGDAIENRTLSRKEIENATLVKLLGVMTTDVRSVIVKLFDRLHNMRTISAMPPHKQEYKAKETLMVYAPLANRLGIWNLKSELERISLRITQQKAYGIIKQRLEALNKEHLEIYNKISSEVYSILLQANIDVRNVTLAPENVYTVYRDLMEKGASFRNIDRTMRLVVIINDWPGCYQALGTMHRLWRPVPGAFDDYIAIPRDNLYQSLHTTVTHSSGHRLKLRFRTPSMDKVAEIGVLAQWMYAGTRFWTAEQESRISAFYANINNNIKMEPNDPAVGVKGVVEDVFGNQIHVYTPQGKVIELVRGATPIDFAYRIHTELGNQCYGAEINDTQTPLNTPLRNGDRVMIIKRPTARPHRTWLEKDLGFIETTYARSNAQRWFRRLSDDEAIIEGKKIVCRELEMIGLLDYSHKKAASLFDYTSARILYYVVGRAELLPSELSVRILEHLWEENPLRMQNDVVQARNGEEFIITSIHGRKLKLCNTCNPRPDDDVSGFVRSDGGVTVHRDDCHFFNPKHLMGKTLRLKWGTTAVQNIRLITIRVDVYDRSGLLNEITQRLKEEEINIAGLNTYSVQEGEVCLITSLEIKSPRQLVRILHQIQVLDNVSSVVCIHKEENKHPQQNDGSLPGYYIQ